MTVERSKRRSLLTLTFIAKLILLIIIIIIIIDCVQILINDY